MRPSFQPLDLIWVAQVASAVGLHPISPERATHQSKDSALASMRNGQTYREVTRALTMVGSYCDPNSHGPAPPEVEQQVSVKGMGSPEAVRAIQAYEEKRP